MSGFIVLTDDGEHLTCKMPADETIVEVQLKDFTIRKAWYACNIMEKGDYDFVPIEDGEDEPEIDRESIADQVIAWRPLNAGHQ